MQSQFSVLLSLTFLLTLPQPLSPQQFLHKVAQMTANFLALVPASSEQSITQAQGFFSPNYQMQRAI